MRRNPVVSEVSDLLVPAILLFGLYVQFHGDFGPGGGFQAGVIFAVGIILYALIHGLEKTRKSIPDNILYVCMALGLLLFAGTGLISMFLDGEFLNYSVLGKNPLAGQHLGILLIELGIGITVAAVLITLFYAFAGRRDK